MTAGESKLPRLGLCSDCGAKIDDVLSRSTPSYQTVTEELLERARLNQIPNNPHERLQLRSLIDNAHDELEHCDDSIAQAEAVLAKLREQRVQIAQRMNASSSLLSPIRKLPVEVLGRIFEFYANHLDAKVFIAHYPRPKLTMQGQMFTLTWICSFWRQIARSYAVLWSDIFVRLRRSDRDASATIELLVSQLKDCLSRSQNRLLRLTVEASDQHYPPRSSKALDALIACSSRWGMLDLNCTKATFRYLRSRLGMHTSNDAPVGGLLEELTASGEVEEVAKFLDIFTSTPRLRSLNTAHFRTPNQMDLSNLVTLRIWRYVGPSLVALLAQCPSLQELDLNDVSLHNESSNTGAILHHKHLSVLYFRYTFDEDVFRLGTWDTIRLPALTRLTICSTSGDSAATFSEMLQEFDSMLARSQCVLEEVTLETTNHSKLEQSLSHSMTDISPGRLVLDETCSDEYKHVYRRAGSAQSDG